MPSLSENDDAPFPRRVFVRVAELAGVLLICKLTLGVLVLVVRCWRWRWRWTWPWRWYRRLRGCPWAEEVVRERDVEMGLLHRDLEGRRCGRERDLYRDPCRKLGITELDLVADAEDYQAHEDGEGDRSAADDESEDLSFSSDCSSESSTFALESESEADTDSGEDGSSSVVLVRVPEDDRCRARTRTRTRSGAETGGAARGRGSGVGNERMKRRRTDRKKGVLEVVDRFLDRVVENVVRFMDEGDGEEGRRMRRV